MMGFLKTVVTVVLATAATVQCVPTSALEPKLEARASGYWMETIKRQGVSAYGTPGYKVFRNVKDYGAVGDGNADDTVAINKAIADGGRCGLGCNSTSTTPAIIYFPSGTYAVSKPLNQFYCMLNSDKLLPHTPGKQAYRV